jgi:hypothetical protein
MVSKMPASGDSMQDKLAPIETALDLLSKQLQQLESRVSQLEGRDHLAATPPIVESPDPAAIDTSVTAIAAAFASESHTVAHVLGLIGRTFLILCGAFLLRSLTDTGNMPLALGVALGLTYASFWLFAADRGAGGGRPLSAVLYGLAAVVIAYPLIWEATTKFALLDADASTALLAVFTISMFTVAWRRNLEIFAWCVSAAALVTNLAILLTYRNWGSGAALALMVGGVSLWFAHSRGRMALRWPVAVIVNVVPLMIVSVSLRPTVPGIPEGPSVPLAVAVLLAYLVVYLGGFSLLMLNLGQRPGSFEFVQSAVCLAVGLTSLAAVTRGMDGATEILGWGILFAGAVSYGVSFAFVDRRLGLGRRFFYYTSLGLILVIWGLRMVADDTTAILILSAIGVAAAVAGRTKDRHTLRAHSAVYVTAAAAIAGLGAQAVETLLLPITGTGSSVAVSDVAVAAAAVTCYVVIAPLRQIESVRWPRRIPAVILAVVALVSLASVGLGWAFEFFGRGSAVGPAWAAAIRTAILSLSAIILAGLGSRRHLLELIWLVYPLLVVTGVKLVLEDLRHGKPLALFVSFAFLGVALIVAPRLLRRPAPPPSD